MRIKCFLIISHLLTGFSRRVNKFCLFLTCCAVWALYHPCTWIPSTKRRQRTTIKKREDEAKIVQGAGWKLEKRGIPKATQALQKGKYQETMKEMLKSLYCRVEIIQKSATCSNLLRLKRQNCFIWGKSIKRVKTIISVSLCCWQNGFKPQKKCSVSSLLFKKPRSHLGISALFLPEDFSAPQ